ncbi:hypothetical protein TELCIR_12393, partial [Teladorsagia circumcincta]
GNVVVETLFYDDDLLNDHHDLLLERFHGHFFTREQDTLKKASKESRRATATRKSSKIKSSISQTKTTSTSPTGIQSLGQYLHFEQSSNLEFSEAKPVRSSIQEVKTLPTRTFPPDPPTVSAVAVRSENSSVHTSLLMRIHRAAHSSKNLPDLPTKEKRSGTGFQQKKRLHRETKSKKAEPPHKTEKPKNPKPTHKPAKHKDPKPTHKPEKPKIPKPTHKPAQPKKPQPPHKPTRPKPPTHKPHPRTGPPKPGPHIKPKTTAPHAKTNAVHRPTPPPKTRPPPKPAPPPKPKPSKPTPRAFPPSAPTSSRSTAAQSMSTGTDGGFDPTMEGDEHFDNGGVTRRKMPRKHDTHRRNGFLLGMVAIAAGILVLLLVVATSKKPRRMESADIYATKFVHGGPLVLDAQLRGPVKHACEEETPSLHSLHFDPNLNEIVDIGSNIEVLNRKGSSQGSVNTSSRVRSKRAKAGIGTYSNKDKDSKKKKLEKETKT